MSTLLGVALFGFLTWLGGVMVDQAWNDWLDDADRNLKLRLLGILLVAGMAWGVILPFWIAPVII